MYKIQILWNKVTNSTVYIKDLDCKNINSYVKNFCVKMTHNLHFFYT